MRSYEQPLEGCGLGLFDEICWCIQRMNYNVVIDKPQSFPPGLVYVHFSDIGYRYETNMTAHMPVEIQIEWMEDQPNTLEDKIGNICLAVERHLAATIPSAVGTFKFRKPEIIHLGTAYKVSLKCTYTKVIDI